MTELEKEEGKMLLSATLQQEHVSCSAAQAVDGMMLPAGLLKGSCRMAAHSICHPSTPPWLASQRCEAPRLGQDAPGTISAQEKGWRKKQQQVCLQMPPLESAQGLELPWSRGAMVVVDENGEGKEYRTVHGHLRSMHL